MRITDYFLVIPDLVLMIVIADVLGASLSHVILVIGMLLWTSTARIIRAQVKSVRERVYVKRARALGASNTRIIWQHILPQVGPLLIANTVLTIAIAIYLETALAFLGLEDPTVTTWGTILENAFQRTAISSGRLVGHRARRDRHRRRHRGLLPVRPGRRGRARGADRTVRRCRWCRHRRSRRPSSTNCRARFRRSRLRSAPACGARRGCARSPLSRSSRSDRPAR